MRKMNFKRIMLLSAFATTFLISQAPGIELGISTGTNSSFYHSWYSQKSEFQKTNFFNPVEIYFRHNFNRFFGIHSALQFIKKSFFNRCQE